MLRLIPKEATVGQFLALNRRSTSSAKEILRRTQAEEELREQESGSG